jgi:hypothetical protein
MENRPIIAHWSSSSIYRKEVLPLPGRVRYKWFSLRGRPIRGKEGGGFVGMLLTMGRSQGYQVSDESKNKVRESNLRYAARVNKL